MISIDLSETTLFAHWKSKTTSETIYFSTKFFSVKKIFRENFFSWILSRTEYMYSVMCNLQTNYNTVIDVKFINGSYRLPYFVQIG